MFKKIINIFKDNFKLIGYIFVVAALLVACVSTLIQQNFHKTKDMGRLVSINPLYDEPPLTPSYTKTSYSTINSTAVDDGSGVIRDEVGAYSDKKNLTEQQKKEKAALEALLASNDRGDDARTTSENRKKKYKLNNIVEVNNNISVTISGSSGSSGNSAVGTAQYATGSSGNYLGQFLLTGYCPCAICCGKTNGITASGKLATSNHTIAADSRYSFGTQMVINGQVYTVEDRGGAITGNHIDVFFNTHSEALAFGKKYADVYLYDGTNGTDNSDSSNDSSSESSEDDDDSEDDEENND